MATGETLGDVLMGEHRLKAYSPKQIAALRRRRQPALFFAMEARKSAPKTFSRRFGQYAKALGMSRLELSARLGLLDYSVAEIQRLLRLEVEGKPEI